MEVLAKEQGLDAPSLLQSRQSHSAPVLQEIQPALAAVQHPCRVTGKFAGQGAALAVLAVVQGGALRHQRPLSHRQHRLWEFDRPFVIGRRNWLFDATVAGANSSASLYSLLETCKVNGVDGYQYLRLLLVALPRARTVDDYKALLPLRLARYSNA